MCGQYILIDKMGPNGIPSVNTLQEIHGVASTIGRRWGSKGSVRFWKKYLFFIFENVPSLINGFIISKKVTSDSFEKTE
jgi:hypothetical protein